MAGPVQAQARPTASGSCGFAAGQCGLDSLALPAGYSTVGRAHWQATYTGVAPGSDVKVLVYYDDLGELVSNQGLAAATDLGQIAGNFVLGLEQGGGA